MCGRITQEQKELNKLLKVDITELIGVTKEYNIGIGENAVVVNSQNEVEYLKFGFNKGGRLNFNGRAEGFNNKDNQLNYSGRLGLHSNPNYKEYFKGSRCLIPVTSFLEGPEKEKLSKPFKIKLNYTDVFMLAGIIGIDEKTGNRGFSIITCWTNEIIKEVVGHHRSPVILDNEDTWGDWLNEESDFDFILSLLHPVRSEDLEITPISPQYKSAKVSEPY